MIVIDVIQSFQWNFSQKHPSYVCVCVCVCVCVYACVHACVRVYDSSDVVSWKYSSENLGENYRFCQKFLKTLSQIGQLAHFLSSISLCVYNCTIVRTKLSIIPCNRILCPPCFVGN